MEASRPAEETLDLLISSGGDINARTEEGQTPLDLQAQFDDDLVAELMRARGAKAGEQIRSGG
jgi:ankyrin repeat protein